MATITLRNVKGSPLTHTEVDDNFSSLKVGADIAEAGTSDNNPNTLVKRDAAGKATLSTLEATQDVITNSIGQSAAQQHSVPAVASDTLTLNAATQTLTNKTLTSPVINGNLLVGTTIPTGARLDVVSDGAGVSSYHANFKHGPSGLSIGLGSDANGVTIGTVNLPIPMRFAVGNGATDIERARITSGGYFKASNTGVYAFPAPTNIDLTNDPSHSFTLTVSGYALIAANTADNAAGYGVLSGVKNAGSRLYEGRLNDTVTYQVLANGNVQNANNSYGAISDAKLKENVIPATPKLDDLMKVEFVNFNLIGDDKKQFGVIAQQLQEVFPSLVDSTPDLVEVEKTRTIVVEATVDEEGNEISPSTTREETYTEKEPNGEVTLSVNYSTLALFACKALQEANYKIEQQQTLIAEMMARLEALEK